MRSKRKPTIGKQISTSLLRSVKQGAKSAVSKINPIDQKINKEDVTDSGIESLRLAATTYKKGKTVLRTTQSTIQTAQRSIKTVEHTTKASVRIVKSTARATVKATTTIMRFTGKAIAHVIAATMNPFCWVIALIGIVVYLIWSVVVVLTGGVNAQRQQEEAYTNPSNWGVDINEDLATAISYYQIACATQQQEVYTLVDGLVYDTTALRISDLVYMERNTPSTVWSKSFATTYQKNTLKTAWGVLLSEEDAIAIVCADWQRQMHIDTTESTLYQVDFTQAQFDALVDICAAYSHTEYAWQECPGNNCSTHTVTISNPQYTSYLELKNKYASAYNDWGEVVSNLDRYDTLIPAAQGSFWSSVIAPAVEQWKADYEMDVPSNWSSENGRPFLEELGDQYEYYEDLLEDTPQTISNTAYTCDHQHTLHSIGLSFLSADEVMNAYGFTETEIQWAAGLAQSIRFYLDQIANTATTTT